MYTLLTKLFIKNRQDITNHKVRQSYGMLASLLGIVLNVFLFAGKYLVGTVSGSIAITADAYNNLSDAGSSIITLIGFLFSGKKPDPDHPYGHGRIEYISGFVVSMAIILMGFELAKSSVDKILHPTQVSASLLTIAILVASIVVKMYMAFYNHTVGKKIDSTAMKATATDSLSDCIATTVVLIVTIITKCTHLSIDGWAGIAVAFFIIYAGINAAKETLSPLLGQAPEAGYVKQIETIVMSHKEIAGMHDLIVHDYGPGRVMISVHAEVPGNGDIYVLHDVIDCIEQELTQQLGCHAVIHMDPIAVDNEAIMSMRHRVAEAVKKLDTRITIHDFRMVEGPTHTNVIFDVVVPFNYAKSNSEVVESVQELVRELDGNLFCVITVDKAYV